jgi:hypothetical protein
MPSRRIFLKQGTIGAVATGVSLGLSDKIIARETRPMSPWSTDRGPLLDRAAFESQLNTNFLVGEKNAAVSVRLVKVGNLGSRMTRQGTKEAFSLVFTGSNASPLNQKTYRINHKRLGEFYFLVVPIMSGDKSVRYYEVVINRLHG